MKKKLIIISVVIMAIMSADIAFSFAANSSDLSDVKDKINTTKEQLGDVEEDLTDAMKEIKSLNSQIAGYEDEIEKLDSQIKEVESKIAEATTNLEKAQVDFDNQKTMLENRLVALYEAGETSFLDVLLNSEGITDFISNYYMVSEIAEYDNDLLDQIEKNKKEIEEAKNTLETSKSQIESLKNNKEATANALKNSQSTKKAYADQLSEKEKNLKDSLEKLEAEQRAIERELAAAANQYSGQIANLGGTGVFQKPVNSNVITATMYYSSGKYHGALDYGVSTGTSVYAAEDGVVLYAGWTSGGYGNYVCIQHGGGLRTYYAHGNGTFYVSSGQSVKKGQLIMLSGNTGNSSGPHLHFEVRVSPYNWSYGGGDSRRDPRNYL